MDFQPGDRVILVSYITPLFPTEEEAIIKSQENNCFIVQRELGIMPVNLDGSIPNWNGGYMKKITQSES